MLDALTAQCLAEDASQWIHAGLGDVGNAEGRRVELVGSSHAGDDGQTQPVASAQDVELGFHRVDAVDDIVEIGQRNGIGILGEVEQGVLLDAALGIDVDNAFGHDVDLQSAECGMEGHDLAVEVSQTDAVGVDEGDGAHATARQHFGYVASHASHAEQHDAGPLEPLHGLGPQQQLGSGKGIVAHIWRQR